MPVMDEFREEREQIRTASPERKWRYFKDYYLKWVIGIIIMIVILISFIASIVTKKEEMLSVELVNFNALETEEEQVLEAFTQQYLEDPDHQMILLDTSSRIAAGPVSENASALVKYTYEDEQKLMALAYTGGLDMMISGQDVIERYLEAGWFVPLDTVLDEDTLAGYAAEERILYYDGEPAAVCMDTAKLLNENYFYAGENDVPIYAAFGGGSSHAELAAEFLKFIEGR